MKHIRLKMKKASFLLFLEVSLFDEGGFKCVFIPKGGEI